MNVFTTSLKVVWRRRKKKPRKQWMDGEGKSIINKDVTEEDAENR